MLTLIRINTLVISHWLLCHLKIRSYHTQHSSGELVHHFYLIESPILESRVPSLCSANPTDSHLQRFRPQYPRGHHKPFVLVLEKAPAWGRGLMGKNKIHPWEILRLRNLAAAWNMRHMSETKGQEDDNMLTMSNVFGGIFVLSFWLLCDRYDEFCNTGNVASVQKKNKLQNHLRRYILKDFRWYLMSSRSFSPLR